jgi:hypothetical protein
MIRKLYSLTLVVAAMIALSCGGGSSSLVSINPAAPGLTGERTADLIPMGSKALWGVWEVIIDTQTMETRVVPQRGVEYTVDAVAFLQYPKGKPTNLQINITDRDHGR